VVYPDCINYEGRKVMVYVNVTPEQLAAQTSLVPHFSADRGHLSPVARFVPTPRGWEMARLFAHGWARIAR
jgi:hypothetical protein